MITGAWRLLPFNLAFSRATDDFFALHGLTPAYRDETLCTIYTLEARTTFLKDCHEGDGIHVGLPARRPSMRNGRMVVLTMYPRRHRRGGVRGRKRWSCICGATPARCRSALPFRRRCSPACRQPS
jgi:hypothetical protein